LAATLVPDEARDLFDGCKYRDLHDRADAPRCLNVSIVVCAIAQMDEKASDRPLVAAWGVRQP
jgi:hypothetical protein